MIKKLTRFINKIQNSNEATKKFWLVIFSGTTMVVVISLWVINMKTNFQNIRLAKPEAATETLAEESELTKLKAIFSAGLKTIASKIKEKAGTQRQISVQTSEQNFILESLDKISATKIP